MKTKYGTSESTKLRNFQTQNSKKNYGDCPSLTVPSPEPTLPKSNSCICPCRHVIRAHSFPLPPCAMAFAPTLPPNYRFLAPPMVLWC